MLKTDDGRLVGCAGRVADALAKQWDLKTQVFVAELDLSAAAEDMPLQQFEELPRFPAVTADMTIEHPTELSFAELTDGVRSLAGALVENIEYLGRYAGQGLPQGAVRTTIRLTYRSGDRSLTQNEVNEQQEALRRGLSDRLGVAFA